MPEGPAANRDSKRNTLIVAIGVSLVCSILVSVTAVILKPLQEQNQDEYRQRIVLEVAGLYDPEMPVDSQFDRVEVRIVDLETGEYTDAVDAGTFDPIEAAGDPELGTAIPQDFDIAGVRQRARYSPVYLVRDEDRLSEIILPVFGSGLWSTMYGYLALAPDGTTIRGLRFYEHAETPGLGDQVDDPAWRAQWDGKNAFGESGEPAIEVIRGTVPPGENAKYQVDGLAGATLTGRGVTNLLHYWLGPHGFGPYLDRFHDGERQDG